MAIIIPSEQKVTPLADWDYCIGCHVFDFCVRGICHNCWEQANPEGEYPHRTLRQDLRRDWTEKYQPQLVSALLDPTRWVESIALLGIGGFIVHALGQHA